MCVFVLRHASSMAPLCVFKDRNLWQEDRHAEWDTVKYVVNMGPFPGDFTQ